jgi:hypothetical protein
MEVIKEHLIYKDVPILICMKSLKPIEQYEVIRIILATRTKDVSICKHESTNTYIDKLLEKIPVTFTHCSQEKSVSTSPPQLFQEEVDQE